jgi:hypothetical protein
MKLKDCIPVGGVVELYVDSYGFVSMKPEPNGLKATVVHHDQGRVFVAWRSGENTPRHALNASLSRLYSKYLNGFDAFSMYSEDCEVASYSLSSSSNVPHPIYNVINAASTQACATVGKLIAVTYHNNGKVVSKVSSRGMNCSGPHCNLFNEYAEPNMPDGSFRCYSCRNR